MNIFVRLVFKISAWLKLADVTSERILATPLTWIIGILFVFGLLGAALFSWWSFAEAVVLNAVLFWLLRIWRLKNNALEPSNDANRIIIAHNLLFEKKFSKLTEHMFYGTICRHLIGNCNVLELNGEIVKINHVASRTSDDFSRIVVDRKFCYAERLEPGVRIKTVRGESGSVVAGDGWKKVSYNFTDMNLLGPRRTLHRIILIGRLMVKRGYSIIGSGKS